VNIEQLRKLCLSFPAVTEQIQWGDALLFKVAGKMFAVASLEPARVWLSLKVTPEDFAELTERPGIIPAPYLARAKWIALESRDALSPAELAPLLRYSYDLVVAKLPRKTREALLQRRSRAPVSRRAPRKRNRRKSPASRKRAN
jgi:predicted DNA-binding protein (MmcQ/YjbR family)